MSTAETSTVIVVRDCDAVTIPSGVPTTLPAHSVVQVVQSVGGAITVRTEDGSLLRIDRRDADAVGLDPAREPTTPAAGAAFSIAAVTDVLHGIYDPEIPIDVVELGLVYRCEEHVDASGRRRIEIDLSMTAPGCGMGEILRDDVERAVADVAGVDEVVATLVWDPPWGFDRLSDAARLRLGLL
jgi:probable FeS assembly SUF system protein SufT